MDLLGIRIEREWSRPTCFGQYARTGLYFVIRSRFTQVVSPPGLGCWPQFLHYQYHFYRLICLVAQAPDNFMDTGIDSPADHEFNARCSLAGRPSLATRPARPKF